VVFSFFGAFISSNRNAIDLFLRRDSLENLSQILQAQASQLGIDRSTALLEANSTGIA
jgi:hypothetical protein